MKINSVDNKANTNFKAMLKINNCGLKYLAEEDFNYLVKKAKKVGTDKDIISFHVSDRQKYMDSKSKAVIGYENFIRSQYSFLSLPKKSYNTMYGGAKGVTEQDCNRNVFEAVKNFIDSINEQYLYKKNSKNLHL